MDRIICPNCQQGCSPIDVHGHFQCDICGQVIEDCCTGDRAQPEEWR